jgi:Flp pilus assembly protein TadG
VTPSRASGDRGFVTAETAVLLPLLVLVAVVFLALVHAAALQSAAQDAAAMGARVAARGEDDAHARAAAARVVPPAATVTVRRAAGLVTVDVRVPVAPAGPLGRLLGPWSVGARSIAADEQLP